mgnify:CR=1 FL=1
MTEKITFYGHATLGLEINGIKILVDPFFDGNPQAKVNSAQVMADYILITHGHGDHVGDSLKIAKRCGAKIIANYEIIQWVQAKGINNAHAQATGGGFHHPFGYLKLTHALHGSNLPDGSSGGTANGFLLTTKSGKKIYVAGDTGLFGDMRLIGEEGIDLAILPVGDNFTMGPQDALRAIKMLQPKHVIPIHYNTWAPITQELSQWQKQVTNETGAQVHILKPGESFTLP